MNSYQIVRSLSTSAAACGKKNFRKFNMYEKRVSKRLKDSIKVGGDPQLEKRFSRGVREPTLPVSGHEFDPYEVPSKERGVIEPFPHHWEVPPNQSSFRPFVTRAMWEIPNNEPYEKEFIEEMIPELIVPDLTGFELKPYVSYRVKPAENEEFTPQDLFHAVYTDKIIKDFNEGKLNEDGSSKEPSAEESLDKEEARLRALKVNSDYV